MNKRATEILEAEAAALRRIPSDNDYAKAIALIHGALAAHGTVIVSGVGKAGEIGRKISSTFNSVGLRSVSLSPLEAAHGDLGVIHKNSVLLVLSNSGKTREIGELITLARRLHKGLKVICITGNKKSPVASASDVVLSTGNPKELGPFGLVPTASSLAMLAIGDVLTILSMEARSFSPAEYQKHHHGGYIGKTVRRLAKKK